MVLIARVRDRIRNSPFIYRCVSSIVAVICITAVKVIYVTSVDVSLEKREKSNDIVNFP